MSYFKEWRNRTCFVWTPERPIEGRPRYSPKFTVNSQKIYLEYSFNSITKHYFIHVCYGGSKTRLNAIVHVEHKNGNALPLSYRQLYPEESNLIWEAMEAEILELVPDFLTNGLMVFHVTFGHMGEPYYDFTLEPPTRKYVPKAHKSVQKEDISVRKEDKSVQTPTYMNVDICLENLSEDFSKLLEQNLHSDAVLICGDRSIGVHKNVLGTRSKVFDAMLHSDMIEGRAGLVEVQDMDSTTFDHFLRYMYTGKLIDLTVDAAKRFYETADKYAVTGLMRRCASYLIENMKPANACDLLVLADSHSDGEFKESVMNYILEEKIHLQDDQWLPFCKCQPVLALEVTNRFCKLQMK